MNLLKEFDQTNTTAWHQRMNEEIVINKFIDAILCDFPLVFVDDSLWNPNNLAEGFRRPWDGVFVPRDQGILLNGPVSGR